MTQWQYGRLIVLYQGERTEVRGWLFKKEFQVQDWIIQWFGPREQSWAVQQPGTDAVPVEILNNFGQAGWEVTAAFHSDGRFEYVLKRDVGYGE
jgi:hypothetical protein